jgi:uncharacterized protein YhaN
MRILSVKLSKFGPFLEQRFDFRQAGRGLHLIYGPNEAGKSSALRGLRYFLFGFPPRSQDDFVFKTSQYRIHASLESTRGDVLECIRRKGMKETLRAGDDKAVISDDTLRAFMGGLSEEQFKQLFGLDHQLLDEGGRLIALGKGHLGEALFAAGAGLAGLRRLTSQLDERKDAIYKARGQMQSVAVELRRLKELREQVQSASLAAEAYAAKDEELREASATANRGREVRDQARAEHGKLERFRAALPIIDQLRAARESLHDVATARTLAEGFEKDYRETAASLIALEAAQSALRSDITKLAGELESLALPAELLAEKEAIERIKEKVAVWSRDKDEAIKADTRRREADAKARDIFRSLIGSTNLDQAKNYRLTIEQTSRIRDLARQRARLQGDLKHLCLGIAKIEREIADVERKLLRSAKMDDVAPLRAAVDLITREGRIDDQLAELTQSCAHEEARIADALARMNPACSLPLERITQVAFPQPEAIEWHRQELAKLKSQVDHGGEELRAARQELFALDGQIEAWRRGEAVPTEDELIEMRRNRDAGLYCVRQRLSGQPPAEDKNEFIHRFAHGRSLMDAVEGSVRDCDALADRLRHEADRVARGHALKSQREEKRRSIADCESNLERWQSGYDHAQNCWSALWEPTGIAPDVPEVMSAWLSNIERLREKADSWRASVLKSDRLARRRDELSEILIEALPELESARSLQDAFDAARERLKAVDEASSERKRHERDLDRHRNDLANARSDRIAIENQLHVERESWAQAVGLLRLAESVEIETVESCLAQTEEMQRHLAESRIKAKRVEEIEADRDVLLHDFNELRGRLSPTSRMTTTADSIERDFAELDRRLKNAEDLRVKRDQLGKQLEDKRKQLDDLSIKKRDVESKIAAMAREAGAADPAQIPDAIERARRRLEAMKRVHELENALAQQSRGMPIQQFETAALEASEGIDQAIDALEATLARADAEVTRADIAADQAQNQLKEWRKASDEAATARQEAAFCARRLQDHVAQYATLHLARHILDRAVERYRSRNQDSMLSRAASFFEQLTGGDFATLEIQNEEGSPVLKAVRSDGARQDVTVSVDGLSDGTRDQLFLALRLAGIERHLADREPMPLIIDDVLINFDDRRATATLRCIAELSKQTQVLLFTHHKHILELAQATVPSHLVTHEFCRAE